MYVYKPAKWEANKSNDAVMLYNSCKDVLIIDLE